MNTEVQSTKSEVQSPKDEVRRAKPEIGRPSLVFSLLSLFVLRTLHFTRRLSRFALSGFF